MKTSRVNTLSAVAYLIALLALSTTAAFGQVPERGSAKGGAMLLMKRSPVIEPSDYQPMTCPKCKNTTVAVRDNKPTKGAAAKAQLAQGVPTKLVSRHECEGCGNEWKSTGHGKAKVSIAVHKCTSCGSEMAACCNTKKGSQVATKGMEKDFKVAPLK
jgi:hypothetical protein